MTGMTPAQLGGLTRRARETLRKRGLKRLPFDLRSEFQELGVKFCPVCRRVLPLDRFGMNRSKSGGRQGECKHCHLDYYRANRDSEVRRMREYHEVNNLNMRLANGYCRALAKGLPAEKFDEDTLRESLESRGLDLNKSAFSGVPLTRENISLDHLVPLDRPDSPGHVPSNIVACTLSENRSKHKRHFVYLLADIHAA